ncbi:MAG: CPBP family intramembrane metalloprotease [Acidobacteriota bacterium]|nr:CPBP family intramembrane metalloprotease [Acidobacteriota bacterium]
MPRDPLRPALQTGIYILLYVVAVYVLGPVMFWLGGYLVGLTVSGFLAAALCNILCMKIYEDRGLTQIGLPWDGLAARNLGMGAAVGAASACLVLLGPLLFRAAHFETAHDAGAGWRAALFLPLLLLCGAAGEEMLFHGFAFQVLLRELGPFSTILPVGIVFGLLHSGNPNATPLGLVNTAGFGILFGCAFLRSHDLWLPMGLHLGWNVALPLFGVNLSGITMRITSYRIAWQAGPLWSGGAYGPEASVLTSVVLVVLLALIWKLPIRRQHAYLLDEASERLL